MSVERKERPLKDGHLRPSKSSSGTDLQASKFLGLLSLYDEKRVWLETRISSCDPLTAIEDLEIRNAIHVLLTLTCKAIRKDPKLLKSKYEDVFWRSVMYPLIRNASDKPEIQSSPVLQAEFQDLITAGITAFRCFVETFLVRFDLKISSVGDLPPLCETCSGIGGQFKPEHVLWIRSFFSRCLSSIGDLYRYAAAFDQKSFALASYHYELAALTRPADGRAVSCLGIVQKDLGEPFTATYYCLLSACKRNRYAFYLKNLEVMRGSVHDLCALYNIETEKPRLDDDPREIIKVFSIHILNIVHGLLLDDQSDQNRMRNRFSAALDYLSATLERPAPDAGSWKSAHYTTTSYLHPNLLWKVCAMVINVYHLKQTEVDVRRGDHLGTLCAFIVAMLGKISGCVVDNLRHWLSYTSFNLVPEPDPLVIVPELEKLRAVVESKLMKKPSVNKIPSATATEPYFERGNGDGPMLLGPSSSTQFEDDPDFQSMEEYWEDAPLDDSGDFDFFDAADFSPEDHAEMGASYLQAFLGFMDTQTHLPLMCLLFQWIRCNDEMWGFCLANFPDIICNIVDIINLLCIPKFVDVYVSRTDIGFFPLEEEIFLRDTTVMQEWVDNLDWSGWHRRPGGLSDIEKVILLVHRFSDMAGVLQKSGIATYDTIHRNWRCNLQRKQLATTPAEIAPKVGRKLEMAMRLGQAFRAEENKEREKGFMVRRSDLPKYLVIDTSCLLRRLEFVQRLYDCKKFKIVIPSYVLEDLDRGKKNHTVREAIRWMDRTTETKDLGRLEIQRWKDMHLHDAQLETDWDKLTNTERSVRVMVDCTKFFSEEVKRRTDDSPEYGLHILVLTDLDLQSVYCARVIEQMERLEVPHEIKLMRIPDFMGWLDEGPAYFRRMQEQEERDRLT